MRSLNERLDEVVTPEPMSGCWLWTGAIGDHGYGTLSVNDSTRLGHRLSYERHVGPIAAGLQLDHLCRNRACVNPRHLEAVTPRINGLRGKSPAAIHAQKTHCPLGHPYDDRNTYLRKDHYGRGCRKCLMARSSRVRSEKRAAVREAKKLLKDLNLRDD